MEQWIDINLFSIEQECSKQIFQNELQNFISMQLESQSLFINEINQENSFWNFKINEKLKYFCSFLDQNSKQILDSLSKYNLIIKAENLCPLQFSQLNNFIISFLQQTDLQIGTNTIAQDGWVKLQLFDSSVKQQSNCQAFAFNKSGTRMVS
ncbi:unnamed protein product [Paramecium octaurelia]|uniref:Uncharacterized protein n=1 Tax=Paramecium octaurelia TaxID=43137 RepID=A0A8S1VA33_PAROT|nr:unnamed protein product [Paramecium octaurelia]